MPASECASRRWWFLRDEFIVGGGNPDGSASPSHAQVTRTGRPIPTCCGCRRGTNKPSWNPMRLQSRLRQPDCEPAMSLLTRRRSPATSVAEGSDRFSVQRGRNGYPSTRFSVGLCQPDCEAGDVAFGQAEARRRGVACGQAEARRRWPGGGQAATVARRSTAMCCCCCLILLPRPLN